MARKLPRGKPPSQRGNRRRDERETDSDPNDLRLIAVHEAGHAVAAVILGIPLVNVALNVERGPNGALQVGYADTATCDRATAEMGPDVALPYVALYLAGMAAEMRLDPSSLHSGGDAADRLEVGRIVLTATCTPAENGTFPLEERERNKPQIDELVERANEIVQRIVTDHWQAIQRVADLLIERRQLSGGEVTAIVHLTAI